MIIGSLDRTYLSLESTSTLRVVEIDRDSRLAGMSDVEAFRCFQSFSYSGKAYAMKSEVPDFPVLLRTWDLAKRLKMDYFQTHLLDCMDARRSEIGCIPDVQVIKEVFEDNGEGYPLRCKFMDWIEEDSMCCSFSLSFPC